MSDDTVMEELVTLNAELLFTDLSGSNGQIDQPYLPGQLWLQVLGLLDTNIDPGPVTDLIYDIANGIDDWSIQGLGLTQLNPCERHDWYDQALQTTKTLTVRRFEGEHFDAARAIARRISRTLRHHPKSTHDTYTVIVDRIEQQLIDAKLIPDDRPSDADLETIMG